MKRNFFTAILAALCFLMAMPSMASFAYWRATKTMEFQNGRVILSTNWSNTAAPMVSVIQECLKTHGEEVCKKGAIMAIYKGENVIAISKSCLGTTPYHEEVSFSSKDAPDAVAKHAKMICEKIVGAGNCTYPMQVILDSEGDGTPRYVELQKPAPDCQ